MFAWLKQKLGLKRLFASSDQDPTIPLPTKSLDKKILYLKRQFRESPDIIIRELNIGFNGEIRAILLFVDGLVDKEALEVRVIQPLIQEEYFKNIIGTNLSPLEAITNHLILSTELKIENELYRAVERVMQGETALLIDGFQDTLVLGHRRFATRAIEEPDTERTTQGPRLGFVENLRINTSLLRRIIATPNLALEMTSIGVVTKTDICIAYVKGIARPELVDEVKRRLKSSKIDGLLSSGIISELIGDSPHSPFPTIGVSERPDKVASKILEGRIAIIVNGTPFVLTVPHLFIEHFQVPSDYCSPWIMQSSLRLLRFVAFLLSIFTVPSYVALTSFHHELLPNYLAYSFAAARMPTPFSAFVEALILSLFFEILREAGIRMPGAVGGAVNIVGALVIGDAAVNAGLVGAPMVISIALTAIANFVIPSLFEPATFLRYFYLLLVGFLGFYGLGYGIIVTLLYLTSLYSFGIPYLSPISPLIPKEMADTFVRLPIWMRVFRPRQFAVDKKRADFRLTHLNNDQGENH